MKRMPVLLRLLLCVVALTAARHLAASETVHGTTRTLGLTGLHQVELEFRTESSDLEWLPQAHLDLSTIETPLPELVTQRFWLTATDEGFRALQMRFEQATPWLDSVCVPPPAEMQGTAIPEPGAWALILAASAFAWVVVRRGRGRGHAGAAQAQ